ncbi:DUF6069 family protein [Nonomuraea pusilla]|uniref:DUF6069 family protein n=1 Tax=Nonomuraea pusilla TaxID=46177 RepID=UPI001160D86A
MHDFLGNRVLPAGAPTSSWATNAPPGCAHRQLETRAIPTVSRRADPPASGRLCAPAARSRRRPWRPPLGSTPLENAILSRSTEIVDPARRARDRPAGPADVRRLRPAGSRTGLFRRGRRTPAGRRISTPPARRRRSRPPPADDLEEIVGEAFVFSVVGIVIAAALLRWSARPAERFMWMASLVPAFLSGANTATTGRPGGLSRSGWMRPRPGGGSGPRCRAPCRPAGRRSSWRRPR